jgi:hypothetical protein
MNFSYGPAAIRWAALFLGAKFLAQGLQNDLFSKGL